MSYGKKGSNPSTGRLSAVRILLVVLYPLMVLECLFEAMGTPRWFFFSLRYCYWREYTKFKAYWDGVAR